uniref:Reticulon domain-containing protein n=1 Tax=Trichuris muris TaxID=70415 RepID=A0A5S6QFK7_TRIMR
MHRWPCERGSKVSCLALDAKFNFWILYTMALLAETPTLEEFGLAQKDKRDPKHLLLDDRRNRTVSTHRNSSVVMDVGSVLTTLSNELHLPQVLLWQNKMFSFLSLSVIACSCYSLTRMNLLYVLGFQTLFLISLCVTIRLIAGDELVLLCEVPSGRLPYPDEQESCIESKLEAIVSGSALLCNLLLRKLLFGDTSLLVKCTAICLLIGFIGHCIPLPWLSFHGTILAFTLPSTIKCYGQEIRRAYRSSCCIIKQMAKNVHRYF